MSKDVEAVSVGLDTHQETGAVPDQLPRDEYEVPF
jgi:hypothetical protein